MKEDAVLWKIAVRAHARVLPRQLFETTVTREHPNRITSERKEQIEIENAEVIARQYCLRKDRLPQPQESEYGMEGVKCRLIGELDHLCHRTKHCSASQYNIPIAVP